MPDHLHVLMEAEDEQADLRRAVAMFKQRSAYAYRTVHRSRLWQEGYFDRVLRDDEQTLDVVAYIVGNPVRAHLCRDLRLSPSIGSSRYSVDQLIDGIQATQRWRP